MTPKPLLLADSWLLDLVQDTNLSFALVAMEPKILRNYTIPPQVEVLDRQQALDGIWAGNFSRLLTSPRRGPFWDMARPLLSRTWEMRKKLRNDTLLRQYRIPEAALAAGIPLAIVERSDGSHIAEWDHPLLIAADTFWLREFPVNPYHILINTSRRLRRLSSLENTPTYRALGKIRPIPLGVSDARLPLIQPAPKKHDIFFAAKDTNPLRAQAREALKGLAGEFNICLPESPLSQEDFYRACSESYLVVSPSGLGWDCFRHNEAALCGSVPVMNFPTIRRHQPYVEGEHCFYYDPDGDGLVRCLREALAKPARLIEMGQKARAHALEHHLYSKVLRTLLA